MTAEEKLAELEDWLFNEYHAALSIWKVSKSAPERAMIHSSMLTLFSVARHLITGSDDTVSVFNERLIIFTEHQDLRDQTLKDWVTICHKDKKK